MQLNTMQIGADKRRQSILVVEPLDGPVLGVGIDDVALASGRHYVFAVATDHGEPVKAGDRCRRQSYRAAVIIHAFPNDFGAFGVMIVDGALRRTVVGFRSTRVT